MRTILKLATQRLAAGLVAMACVTGLTVATAQPAEAACTTRVTFHGKVGYALCGTGWTIKDFGDVERGVLIGANRQVYNIVYYQSTGYVSNWSSLGGTAYFDVWFVSGSTAQNLTVRTIGSDDRYWCKGYNGSWGGWFRC